ncbi:MAG TPA: hypothetical protein VEV84_10530 [Pyrinomonadaceae bacterium]|nr:hypothetical protein [Pyrinomonadaceae bacterium]
MEDTTLDAAQVVRDVVMSKSVEERLLICAQMYEEAKEFAKIGMPEGLSEVDQEAFIFERIHGISPLESVTSNQAI